MKISKCNRYSSAGSDGSGNRTLVGEYIYIPYIENQADVFALPVIHDQSKDLRAGRTTTLDGLPLAKGNVFAGAPCNRDALATYSNYANEHGLTVILHTNSGFGFLNAGTAASSIRYVSLGCFDGDVIIPCLDMPTLVFTGEEIDQIGYHDEHEVFSNITGKFINSCPGGYGGNEGPCGPHFRIEVVFASNAARNSGRPAHIMHSDYTHPNVPGYPFQLVTFVKHENVTNAVQQYLEDADDVVGSETYDFFWNML